MVIFHGKLLVYQRLVKVSGYLYQISLDDFIALVELIGDRDAKKSISALVAVCYFAWKRWTKVPFLAENPDVSG
jgi:hypothetical protein